MRTVSPEVRSRYGIPLRRRDGRTLQQGGDRYDEIRFSAKLGIAGEVTRTRQVLVVPEAYDDPRFNRAIDRKTGYRTRNILTVPLIPPDGDVIGVLQLLNKTGGPFDERDEMMAGALGSLIGITIKRQILLDAAARKERLEHDLGIARRIQTQLLPDSDPRVPGFDIAGWNQPADETGGDCYGFLPLHDGRLLFFIADASGHGIGPALVVTECRAMLRALADESDDLSHIVARVNRLLCEDLPAGHFLTACLAILDPKAARVDYISAGHGPLLHYHAASGEIDVFGASGLPMAVIDDTDYESAPPIDLQPGDIFCLLTDGFIEWQRADGQQYGAPRLQNTLRQHAGGTCRDLIGAVRQEVLAFGGGTAQADDLTAVIVKRTTR